ncbi:hypothetical protein M427DRAFT_53481, partial [Gonapodya prolifera JEL478]
MFILLRGIYTDFFRSHLYLMPHRIGDTVEKSDATSLLPAVDVTVIVVGDSSAFPFDEYDSTFLVLVSEGAITTTSLHSIPLGFSFSGLIGNYALHADVTPVGSEAQGLFAYQMSVTIGGSVTTKFFTIVARIIMRVSHIL